MIFGLFLAALWGASVSAQAEEVLELGVLLEEARQTSPELQAALLRAQAQRSRVDAAGVPADPMLGAGARSVPIGAMTDPMAMGEIMLRQRFAPPGALRADRQQARMEALAAGEDARAFELAVEERVRVLYARLWRVVAAREVWHEQQDALELAAEQARSRVATVGASLAEPLRMDLERLRIQEELAELEAREQALRADLGAQMGRTQPVTGHPRDLPAPPDFGDELDSHPVLAGLEARRRAQEAQERLARREGWPDYEVGLTYGWRPAGADAVGTELMVAIPLFRGGRARASAAAARHGAEALAQEQIGRRQALDAEAHGARSARDALERTLALYREELVPRAERQVEVTRSAYQAGEVDFLALLDAWLVRYGHERELLRLQAERFEASARLGRALGQPAPEGGPTGLRPEED